MQTYTISTLEVPEKPYYCPHYSFARERILKKSKGWDVSYCFAYRYLYFRVQDLLNSVAIVYAGFSHVIRCDCGNLYALKGSLSLWVGVDHKTNNRNT